MKPTTVILHKPLLESSTSTFTAQVQLPSTTRSSSRLKKRLAVSSSSSPLCPLPTSKRACGAERLIPTMEAMLESLWRMMRLSWTGPPRQLSLRAVFLFKSSSSSRWACSLPLIFSSNLLDHDLLSLSGIATFCSLEALCDAMSVQRNGRLGVDIVFFYVEDGFVCLVTYVERPTLVCLHAMFYFSWFGIFHPHLALRSLAL